MSRFPVLLLAVLVLTTATARAAGQARASDRSTTGPRSVTTAETSELTGRVWTAFEDDPHATAATCRQVLRLEEPTLETRRDRRARRLELVGWSFVGLGVLGGLAGGIAVARPCSEDAFFCLDGPAVGALYGVVIAMAPVTIGAVMGAIGTARRRRAKRAGTWTLAWTGAGGRFGLTF